MEYKYYDSTTIRNLIIATFLSIKFTKRVFWFWLLIIVGSNFKCLNDVKRLMHLVLFLSDSSTFGTFLLTISLLKILLLYFLFFNFLYLRISWLSLAFLNILLSSISLIMLLFIRGFLGSVEFHSNTLLAILCIAYYFILFHLSSVVLFSNGKFN